MNLDVIQEFVLDALDNIIIKYYMIMTIFVLIIQICIV